MRATNVSGLAPFSAGSYPSGEPLFPPRCSRSYFAAVTRKLGIPAEAARRRVAALGRLEVVTLYTEDLQHGSQFESLRVVNPSSIASARQAARSALTPPTAPPSQHVSRAGSSILTLRPRRA
jgi:hypothetical protein